MSHNPEGRRLLRYSVGDQLAVVADRKNERFQHLVTIAAMRQGTEEASYCLQGRGAPAFWLRESHLLRLRPTLNPPVGD